MSTPEWNAPSPLKGSMRSPNDPVIGPSTGHIFGAELARSQSAVVDVAGESEGKSRRRRPVHGDRLQRRKAIERRTDLRALNAVRGSRRHQHRFRLQSIQRGNFVGQRSQRRHLDVAFLGHLLQVANSGSSGLPARRAVRYSLKPSAACARTSWRCQSAPATPTTAPTTRTYKYRAGIGILRSWPSSPRATKRM